MFHNELAANANRMGELLENLLETINTGEKLEEYQFVLVLASVRLMMFMLATELETATRCNACGAELHRACPNCTEWDFDRER